MSELKMLTLQPGKLYRFIRPYAMFYEKNGHKRHNCAFWNELNSTNGLFLCLGEKTTDDFVSILFCDKIYEIDRGTGIPECCEECYDE